MAKKKNQTEQLEDLGIDAPTFGSWPLGHWQPTHEHTSNVDAAYEVGKKKKVIHVYPRKPITLWEWIRRWLKS